MIWGMLATEERRWLARKTPKLLARNGQIIQEAPKAMCASTPQAGRPLFPQLCFSFRVEFQLRKITPALSHQFRGGLSVCAAAGSDPREVREQAHMKFRVQAQSKTRGDAVARRPRSAPVPFP